MGLGGAPISLAELKAVGVVHISIGGLLVKAIFGLVRRAAARVIMQDSKFSIANIWIAGHELCELFIPADKQYSA